MARTPRGLQGLVQLSAGGLQHGLICKKILIHPLIFMHKRRSPGWKFLILATIALSILRQTLWFVVLHCFGPGDRLHSYVSFIRIPVHYFAYDVLRAVNVDSLMVHFVVYFPGHTGFLVKARQGRFIYIAHFSNEAIQSALHRNINTVQDINRTIQHKNIKTFKWD